MASVRLVNVTKRFGDVVALDRVDLVIPEGEFVALLGPSGSGKTTLLRIIAGLTQPSSGDILIGGISVRDIEVRKRNLSMVFQNYALFPHLTVAENIGYGLKVRKVAPKVIDQKIKELLEMVNLPHIEKRFPHQLSGGQQQRVALARALVIGPKVLLLDEPLGALDKKLRESMQIELKLLQQRLGITTIFVTHDQEEALTMSDRIAVMNEGRVVQFDSPSNIYERPVSKFVSGFIGVSNYYECHIVGSEERFLIAKTPLGSSIFICQDLVPNQGETGEPIVLAVRPEKIILHRKKPQGSKNVFPATVQNVVYLGSMTHYYLHTENGEKVVVHEQNLNSLDEKRQLIRGDEVFIGWPPEASQVVNL